MDEQKNAGRAGRGPVGGFHLGVAPDQVLVRESGDPPLAVLESQPRRVSDPTSVVN